MARANLRRHCGRSARHEFLERTRTDADALRAHLSELLMAQGYQDITGQIIRSVIALVDELERCSASWCRSPKATKSRAWCAASADAVELGAGPGSAGCRNRQWRCGVPARTTSTRCCRRWRRASDGLTHGYPDSRWIRARAGRGAGGRRAQGRGHHGVAVVRRFHDRRGGHHRLHLHPDAAAGVQARDEPRELDLQAAAAAGRGAHQEDRRVEQHRAQAGVVRPRAADRAGDRTRS